VYDVCAGRRERRSISKIIRMAARCDAMRDGSGVTPSITIAYFKHPAILAVTVTNTAGSGTPTGAVRLLDNGVQAPGASIALDGSGQASFSTLGLSFGNHTLSVAFDGDGNSNPATSITIPIRITPGVRPLP